MRNMENKKVLLTQLFLNNIEQKNNQVKNRFRSLLPWLFQINY